MQDLPSSQFFDQCQTFFFKYPRTLSEKCVCPPFGLWSARPIRSDFTSALVSIWTSFWRRDFLLESSEILWKRWTQSICNWSYTPLYTVFTGLWILASLRWVSSSARLRNSFNLSTGDGDISRAEIEKNGFSSLRQITSSGQNMTSFHVISLPAPIVRAVHIRQR